MWSLLLGPPDLCQPMFHCSRTTRVILQLFVLTRPKLVKQLARVRRQDSPGEWISIRQISPVLLHRRIYVLLGVNPTLWLMFGHNGTAGWLDRSKSRLIIVT